jgi:hypothetical protein
MDKNVDKSRVMHRELAKKQKVTVRPRTINARSETI